ncbi:ornithine carbamoyltransferase, partial [Chloroflexota bacterium]
IDFRIATPPGYEPKPRLQQKVSRSRYTRDPKVAVRNADVVYTDVWISMGQEAETERRRAHFSKYQVDSGLLALAKKDAIFMHPLPAHHGEEVADGLLDLPQSVVFDQAENRLHMQKAILVELLGVL